MVFKEIGFEHMSKVLPGIYRLPTANQRSVPANAVIATGVLWPSLVLSCFLVGKNIDPLEALRGGGSNFFSPGGLPHTDLKKLSASLSKSSLSPVELLSQIKFSGCLQNIHRFCGSQPASKGCFQGMSSSSSRE